MNCLVFLLTKWPVNQVIGRKEAFHPVLFNRNRGKWMTLDASQRQVLSIVRSACGDVFILVSIL